MKIPGVGFLVYVLTIYAAFRRGIGKKPLGADGFTANVTNSESPLFNSNQCAMYIPIVGLRCELGLESMRHAIPRRQVLMVPSPPAATRSLR